MTAPRSILLRFTTGMLAVAITSGCAFQQIQGRSLNRSAYPSLKDDDLAAVAAAGSRVERPWLKPVPVDFGQPLDGQAISLIAVVANPDLKALRQRARVADAQVYAAGLLPDPVISIGTDFVIGGPATAVANTIAGSITQDLNALRTRGAALAGAKSGARQARLDLAWAEWQTAGQARLLAARARSLKVQLGLLDHLTRTAADLRLRNQRAAGRGDIPGEQLQAARLAEVDALAQFNQGEIAEAQARANLNRQLGLPPGISIALAPPSLPADRPNCESIYSVARHRPDLEALAAGFDAQSSAVRQAILARFPTLDLTINGSRNESGNRFLGPAVNLTLPLWNRGRGTLAVALATRDALQTEYDARLFKMRADISDLCIAEAITTKQLAFANTELPALESYAAATARAASRGDLAGSVADNAAMSVWSRRLLIEQLRQTRAEQLLGLEIASGTVMSAWGAQ